jgi:nucleolar protein 56
LYESASGYALFERTGGEEIAERGLEVQQQLQDFKNFSKNIHLRSFTPFASSENALQNINDVSEGTEPGLIGFEFANSVRSKRIRSLESCRIA